MYRIRLMTGEEAAFRTVQELATAVKSGVISPTAEVFHNAGNRWLPIHMHPDYRAVITGQQPAVAASTRPVPGLGEPPGPTATRPVPGLAEPRGPELTPLLQQLDALPPAAPVRSVFEYDPTRDPTPVRTSLPTSWRRIGTYHKQKVRWVLAVSLGFVGLGLVGGGGYLGWRYLLPWLEQHRAGDLGEGMSPAPPEAIPAPKTDSAPTRHATPAPPLSVTNGLEASPPPLPPDTHTSRSTTTRNRTPTYFEAYADSRADMDEALDYIDFRRVFAPYRFASPDSVRAARRMVAAAGNILRVYRGREVMLEQTYRPDDLGGQGSLRESFETAEAARAIAADVDSLFGLLVAQEGRVRYSPESVSFEDPHARQSYADLRERIMAAARQWRDSAEAKNLVTIPRLLRAFGGSVPPPLRQ